MRITDLTRCNACARCEIRGWVPGADVQDAEFACVLGLAPKDGECPSHEPGDPWEEIKRKELAWRKG